MIEDEGLKVLQSTTKKVKIICIIIAAILLMVSGVAFANEEADWSLTMLTSNNSVTTDSSTDILLINGIIYVYSRTVANFYEMTLGWNGTTREVSLAYKDILFAAVVDSSTCTINGKVVNLINPVRMSSGRTYLSVIDLSLLGLDVVIDDKTAKATVETPRAKLESISWTKDGGSDVVEITFSREVEITKSVLSVPDRLVIDAKDSKYDATLSIPTGVSPIVTRIRVGENTPRVVRIVFDLALSASATVEQNANVIRVKFNNPITDLKVTKNDEIEDVVIISEAFINSPAVIVTGENVFYYDLAGTTLVGGNKEYIPSDKSSGIEWVRVAQFDLNTVRFAVKVKTGYKAEYVSSSNPQEFVVKVSPIQRPDSIESRGQDARAIVESVLASLVDDGVIEPISGYQSTVVTIKVEDPTAFNVFRLQFPDRIVIDLPGVDVSTLVTEKTGPESVITSIRTSQFTKEDARVVLDVNAKCTLTYTISEDRTEIRLKLDTSIFAGKVIMIDPGHGGHDPGASTEDAIEKKINLSVALKLRDMLVQAGATVIMTRDTDVYTSLTDRSSLANRIMPDVFISIHSNSAWAVTAAGSESYYNNLEFFSKQLATFVLDELVKVTGQTRRRVEFGDLHVVRETFMPSTLIELGFISNAAERARLISDEYQDKAALGIFNGLEKYFASEAYENWAKLKNVLIDTKLVGDPKITVDALTLINELLKEYKLSPDSIKYIAPEEIVNGVKALN